MQCSENPRLTRFSWLVFALLLCGSLVAGETSPQRGHPVGYPIRAADLDVLPGFLNPPPGYGEVAFYWWLGDTLTQERLLWQMDQLAGRGVTGLQVNYAHSDSGGYSYGLTLPSHPRLFSNEWWELFKWFLSEAKKRGMSVSLSDYTLGRAGQGWYVDEILKEDSTLRGTKLSCLQYERDGGSQFRLDVPQTLLVARAYRLESRGGVSSSGVDLGFLVQRNQISWNVPSGKWKILLVCRSTVPASIDPMNPLIGKKYVEKFFQRFENHCPGEAGKGLNFFFSDELDFGIRGFLWNDFFAREFKKRKQYDIVPELPALFLDIGPRTPKVRMDYNDVMVALSEEHFFKPLYDWHTERGMLFGCDHGGRGTDVAEFGDYFRTQRWMSGPGCDQPELSRNVVKNKVASSIAHLYERPRTWLEGYHSSNWGTSSAQVADATFANFAMGHNLLSLHGLYYSTHGSWWEWAPPDNHFRQPYWADMATLLKCTERLSYLLSQGHHRCDAAIVYPVAPVEAGIRGEESVRTAFSTGSELYAAGIDFDFMDFESLARARVSDGELQISGERYRVLVLPAMSAVRYSTMQKALEFSRAGGLVLAVGSLPEASDRIGRSDVRLESMVKEVFGITTAEIADSSRTHPPFGKSARPGVFVESPARAVAEVNRAIPRDFEVLSGKSPAANVLHRRVGPRDIYYVYGVSKGTDCYFRSRGRAELWNPWDGSAKVLPVVSTDQQGTRLRMPLTEHEPQVVVFGPGEPERESRVQTETGAEVQLSLDGEWEFELRPTLDNRWGDYRLPAFDGRLAAEASIFRYKVEIEPLPPWHLPQIEDGGWSSAEVSYGAQFWKLGPLPPHSQEVAQKLSRITSVDPRIPVEVNGKPFYWTSHEFSWRWGVKGDPGHQGYHGLKGVVHNDLIELGRPLRDWRGVPGPSFKTESENVYYLWSTVLADRGCRAEIREGGLKPTGVWLNHELLGDTAQAVDLEAGATALLLRYEGAGRGYYVFEASSRRSKSLQPMSLASDWFNKPSVLRFDVMPQVQKPVGWYRCTAPPGLRSIRLGARGIVRIWVEGAEVPVQPSTPDTDRTPEDGVDGWQAVLPAPVVRSSSVAIRIEQKRGFYGGGAIPEPVMFDCSTGLIQLGDLSGNDVLGTYSGGLVYRRDIQLSLSQVSSRRILLDLGDLVASAQVRVNGDLVGSRPAPPWTFDITGKTKVGLNRIEVLVHNTLGNHYRTVPSQYVGNTTSGLLGPVVIRFSE